MENLHRLAIHSMTTKPWDLPTAAKKYAEAGIRGVGLWRQWLEGRSLAESKKILDDNGLSAASLVRSGFYPYTNESERVASYDDNIKALDEAAAVGAPQVVLVCGAKPELSIDDNRKQIAAGIASLADYALKLGVKLAIEPLHPMYADCRSAVNTIGQCNDMIDEIGDEQNIGIAVDVYHVWWDPQLKQELKRAGKRVCGYHACDWMTPTNDFLEDRGLMGEGCIDNKGIRRLVDETGFNGWIEVEIFSKRWWSKDQDEYLAAITDAYLKYV